MTTADFLRAVWARQGFRCLVTQTPAGKLRHYWSTVDKELVERIAGFEAAGLTVFHACATYTTRENRRGDNAAFVRSIWMDIDVDPENPEKYESQAAAVAGLARFLQDAKLPPPWVVNSGGGVHCYWVFDEDVEASRAKVAATLVKRLAHHFGFRIDPSRTADMASILRPVGCLNRKYDPMRVVEAKLTGATYEFGTLFAAIESAASPLPKIESKKKKLKGGVNAEFLVQQDYPPSDANLVADQCAQVGKVRSKLGDVAEPLWYATLAVLASCIDGKKIAHEWSKGHPNYRPEETEAKIAQQDSYGPATCETFAFRAPGGCAGCPHRGKITSPIQLGIRLVELPPPQVGATVLERGADDPDDDEEEVILKTPAGFTRSEQGIWLTPKEGDKRIVHNYDLYVEDIALDESAGHQICVVRHFTPQDGWRTFSFRSALVASDKDFEMAVRDNGVMPADARLLRIYVSLSMTELQKVRKARPLYASMGWKDGMKCFVLGDKAYYPSGRVERVGVSPAIRATVEGIRAQGSLEAWSDVTSLLNAPGMEAHAMVFAAGAGAPLLKFTGYEGAVFNAVGLSNAGKTSMARFFTSMYGDFAKLKLKQSDTANAKVERIGVMSNLPVYVDELTNEDPKQISDFIYEITQGRSKLRLRENGSERTTFEWSTIVVSSTNSPLAGKLRVVKANSEAERLRLFEFRVGRQTAFDDAEGSKLYRTCSENFGHAGEHYIRYVVTHMEEVRRGLDAFIEVFKKHAQARAEERMWIASICCSLYGLKIMRDIGLIRFDVAPVVKWAVEQVKISRGSVDQDRTDPIETLGDYMNIHAPMRLTVKQIGKHSNGDPDYIVERYPTQQVQMRFDVTEQKMWLAQRHFSDWLSERYENASEVFAFLEAKGVARKSRKTLGAGTTIGTSQVRCIEVDMKNPLLGNYKVQLVSDDAKPPTQKTDTPPLRSIK
ncbi:MAG: DUF927 domain-containing protein [Patescibacteria group bacterium]|nr:DUF927 domain-containing protein [Patescibacteria group bacterium]